MRGSAQGYRELERGRGWEGYREGHRGNARGGERGGGGAPTGGKSASRAHIELNQQITRLGSALYIGRDGLLPMQSVIPAA